MKRTIAVIALIFCAGLAGAQQLSTQYKTIAYSWTPGTVLAVCPAGTTTSCVKDYALTLTDPTGKVQPAIPFTYPAATYSFAPGGFLYCGAWKGSLAIEYFDDTSTAKATAPATNTVTVSCPFVVSPPTNFNGVPSA